MEYKKRFYYWGFVEMVVKIFIAIVINVYYEEVIFKT